MARGYASNLHPYNVFEFCLHIDKREILFVF